jgi:hypothetical protein
LLVISDSAPGLLAAIEVHIPTSRSSVVTCEM